jgi:glyoxylase-like metal-dependent hydrolase (beta-lactamase superfamily II)
MLRIPVGGEQSSVGGKPTTVHRSPFPGLFYNRAMILETFPVGPLQCNCTILGDEETHEAIVIDPGDEITRVHRRLTELGLTLNQILITHGHIDHVGGALKLKRFTGAPILLNQNDLELLAMMDEQASWVGIPTPAVAPPDESLNDGLVVGLAHYPAQVIHTPGHTQGSICLHFAPQKLLFAGDTLFAGSIGRTDLPGGNSPQILRSIHSKLLVLPEETRVIAGHGPNTTIGEERETNPFLVAL